MGGRLGWSVRWVMVVCAGIAGLLGTGTVAEAVAPPGQFEVDAAAGTVHDVKSGLIWQRGFSLVPLAWEIALTHCEGLLLGGWSDWRLPNYLELQSIVDNSRVSPSIDVAAFPATPSQDFWSSSPVFGTPGSAFRVSFDSGSASGAATTTTYRVRCVRTCLPLDGGPGCG